MNQLVDNMIRAAKLDIAFYKKAKVDQSMFGQSMLVVVLSSVAAGIGNIGAGITGILPLLATVSALIGWYVWAYLTYLIGTKLLPEPQTRAEMVELLRTIGFSSSPGIIRILGIIPGLATIAELVAGIWMLVAMVVAVRQALDYSNTGRAIGVCVIGWVIHMIIIFVLVGAFLAAVSV